MSLLLENCISQSCLHSRPYIRSRSAVSGQQRAPVGHCRQQHPHSDRPSQRDQLLCGKQHHDHKLFATAVEAVETEPQPANLAAPPPEIPPVWKKLLQQQDQGDVIESKIVGVNKGGVLIDVDGIQGFIPFSKIDKSRFDQSQGDNRGYLIGQDLKAKLIQVDVPGRRLVLSESATLMADLAAQLQEGDVVEGVVTGLRDYGAFVSIRSADGELHGTQGLIHISELSWSKVSTPEMVVQPGSLVRCKVCSIDREGNKIGLSLKQMEADPLMETLESVLPAGQQPEFSEVPCDIPPSIEDICNALKATQGITAVNLGRCAREKRAVSQDLEVWIAKTRSEDGLNLVARSGSLLFEIHVVTGKSATEMRTVLQKTLQQMN